MEREPFNVELFHANELYQKEAEKKFKALKLFAAEFLNLQIMLAQPGFVNYSLNNCAYEVRNGCYVRRED